MAVFPQVGEVFGRYQILARLGQGGMGVVFRALQTDLGREVALKVLPPQHLEDDEFRVRFKREAAILASLDSPHIITVFDHGEHQGCLFIATQLVPGQDLARRLESEGPLPVDLALDVLAQVTEGLAVAHEAGIVHRDVKPSNVLLRTTRDGVHAYLCDFGIARGQEDELTRAGVVVGTFAYLAPERCTGADASPASDVYALGCVLVAALSGRAPYTGTDFEVQRHHVSSPVPQWDGTTPTPNALNDVLRRSMAKDPADRYASAVDLRRDLLAARRLTPGDPEMSVPVDATVLRPGPAAPADTRETPPTGTGRRRGVVAALAALLLVAAGGVGLAVARGGPSTSEDTARAGAGAAPAPATPSPSTPSPATPASSSPAAPRTRSVASDPPRTFPLRNLGCTGQYVVVLATRIDASTPLRSIEGIMAGFDSPAEHAQYAESSGSCSNLGAIRGKGAARWIPYFGAFDDGGSACRARAAHADSTTYVVRLDEGATDAVFCACVTETSALPVLTPQNAGRPPRDLMLWVLGLQYMLRDAGYPPSALTGNYLGSTTQRVTELQRDGGLPPTGDVDADTWDALKRRLCPPGS